MVDKELASQLLIDVKNSQEMLQKKAYKICGYHFNFNSSKDVAKVIFMHELDVRDIIKNVDCLISTYLLLRY